MLRTEKRPPSSVTSAEACAPPVGRTVDTGRRWRAWGSPRDASHPARFRNHRREASLRETVPGPRPRLTTYLLPPVRIHSSDDHRWRYPAITNPGWTDPAGDRP